MKKVVKEIIIRNFEMDKASAFVISSLDVFKANRNGLVLHQHHMKPTNEPFLKIRCNLELTKKKSNELKKHMKKLLAVPYVSFVTEEK